MKYSLFQWVDSHIRRAPRGVGDVQQGGEQCGGGEMHDCWIGGEGQLLLLGTASVQLQRKNREVKRLSMETI